MGLSLSVHNKSKYYWRQEARVVLNDVVWYGMVLIKFPPNTFPPFSVLHLSASLLISVLTLTVSVGRSVDWLVAHSFDDLRGARVDLLGLVLTCFHFFLFFTLFLHLMMILTLTPYFLCLYLLFLPSFFLFPFSHFFSLSFKLPQNEKTAINTYLSCLVFFHGDVCMFLPCIFAQNKQFSQEGIIRLLYIPLEQ